MKKVSKPEKEKKRIVFVLASVILYGLMNWAFSSLVLPGAPVIAFRPQIAVLIALGIVYGPIAGFCAGFFGNAIGDILSGYGYVYWNWHIANGLIGFIPGFISLFGISTIKTVREFGILQFFIILGCFGCMSFGTLTECFLLHRLALIDALLNWMLPGAITNILNALVLVPLILIVLKRLIMTLETRTMLVICFLLIASVLATTAVLTWQANKSVLSVVHFGNQGAAEVFNIGKDVVSTTTLKLLRWAGLVSVFVLMAGLFFALFLARRITAPVALLSRAAHSLENGEFNKVVLEPVSGRSDELGKLAVTFLEMAKKVHAREQDMKERIKLLKIEIDRKEEDKQVAEITETEYFKALQKKTKKLRKEKAVTKVKRDLKGRIS